MGRFFEEIFLGFIGVGLQKNAVIKLGVAPNLGMKRVEFLVDPTWHRTSMMFLCIL